MVLCNGCWRWIEFGMSREHHMLHKQLLNLLIHGARIGMEKRFSLVHKKVLGLKP
jgi:hypothetical protein